jgi:hypothetical protein
MGRTPHATPALTRAADFGRKQVRTKPPHATRTTRKAASACTILFVHPCLPTTITVPTGIRLVGGGYLRCGGERLCAGDRCGGDACAFGGFAFGTGLGLGRNALQKEAAPRADSAQKPAKSVQPGAGGPSLLQSSDRVSR